MDDFDFAQALEENDGLCPEGCECPECENEDMDTLIWNEETGTVTCANCGTEYVP